MNESVNQIKYCEVCGNPNPKSVLDLGLHPMCDDLVAIGDKRTCLEYPIEILFCEKCITAHQKYQVPKQDLFPVTYHYRSRFTADVLKGMQSLVESCSEKYGSLNGKRVLDVGCNDGSLLGFFRDKGALTFGIEPTGAFEDARSKGHEVMNDFLTTSIAKKFKESFGTPDFITFTNVFAHIENLSELLESLRILMGPQTVLVIENHYLGSVMDGNQFDTFYHEHPRTYSFTSFTFMAANLGKELHDVQFPARYGGNIRVFIGSGGNRLGTKPYENAALRERENGFSAGFKTMRENIEVWKAKKSAIIQNLVSRHGPLRAKAFPGRAAILVKLLNLDTNSISVVFEKPGSLKIGNYLPGTKIPIDSDDVLFKEPNQNLPILNLAWHIPSEIQNYLSANGYRGEIVNILDKTDFSAAA